MYRYLIDVELRAKYRGPGAWRCYHLVSQGDTIDEFVKGAVIVEFDNQGGEIATYPWNEAPTRVRNVADKALADEMKRVHDRIFILGAIKDTQTHLYRRLAGGEGV